MVRLADGGSLRYHSPASIVDTKPVVQEATLRAPVWLLAVDPHCGPDWDRSRVVLCIGCSGSAATPGSQQSRLDAIGGMPLTDWEIKQADIEICKRPDGSLWHLGAGMPPYVRQPAVAPGRRCASLCQTACLTICLTRIL